MISVRNRAAPASQFFDCLDVNNDDFMTRPELTGLLDAVAAVRARERSAKEGIACVAPDVVLLLWSATKVRSGFGECAFPRNIAIAIGPAQRSLRSDLLPVSCIPGALITHEFRRNSLLKETPICTTDHLCPEHWHLQTARPVSSFSPRTPKTDAAALVIPVRAGAAGFQPRAEGGAQGQAGGRPPQHARAHRRRRRRHAHARRDPRLRWQGARSGNRGTGRNCIWGRGSGLRT
jgi:hypothetical protein